MAVYAEAATVTRSISNNPTRITDHSRKEKLKYLSISRKDVLEGN